MFIWEDEQLRDEPENGNPDYPNPDDYYHYDHIYTSNLPETRDVLLEMYQTIKNYTLIDGYDRYLYSISVVGKKLFQTYKYFIISGLIC